MEDIVVSSEMLNLINQRTQANPELLSLQMKKKRWIWKTRFAWIGLVEKFIRIARITKRPANVIQEDGTLVTQHQQFNKDVAVLVMMRFFGSLIGLAAAVIGNLKAAERHTTEVNFWMNTCSILRNISGLTGECKHISRKSVLLFGIRNLKLNIHMMTRLYKRSSKK